MLENSRGLILPTNPNKTYWDFLVIFLLVYTASWVPFKVCFVDDTTDFQFWFDIVVDCCFFTDIILNFFTIVDLGSGQYETRRGAIACLYIKGWFFLDLFTTIPF